MGDLEDAIREHLELKRRRGADPSQVAREEEEALAPVTRSHPVVAPPAEDEAQEAAPESPPEPVDAAQNGAGAHDQDSTPEEGAEEHGDATQEYLLAHDDPLAGTDWLEDEDS